MDFQFFEYLTNSKERLTNFFGDMLEEDLEITDTQLKIVTMEEDSTILTLLNQFFATDDVDLMEFTLKSKMVEDEDGNFITTMIFTEMIALN